MARERLWLGLLTLAALLLYAVPFWWGLSGNELWALDEPRPTQIVPQALGSKSFWSPLYPPLHKHFLHGLMTVSMPLVERASRATGVEVGTLLHGLGRAFTLPFALGTLLLVRSIARRLYGSKAGWLAAVTWLGVAPQAYYAKTMNLDAPYLFWFALALWFFLRFASERRSFDLAAFALAAGCAVLTKDQAYGLFVLPGLLILVWVYRGARARGESVPRAVKSTLLDVRLVSAAFALALLVAIVYRVWNGWDEVAGHVRTITGWQSMGRFREYSGTLVGQLKLARASWANLRFCMGWIGLGLGVVAVGRELLRVARTRASSGPGSWLLLFPLSYYLTFVAVIRYSYDRFFLPVALVLAILSGSLLATLLEAAVGKTARRLAICAVALGLTYGVARSVVVDLSMLYDGRNVVARRVTGGGRALAVAGRSEVFPRSFEHHSLKRFKKNPCARLNDFEFIAIQPSLGDRFVDTPFARGLESGEYGFRRLSLPRFRSPSWLYDTGRLRTNLFWINLPTWLYQRDPSLPCRDSGRPRSAVEEPEAAT